MRAVIPVTYVFLGDGQVTLCMRSVNRKVCGSFCLVAIYCNSWSICFAFPIPVWKFQVLQTWNVMVSKRMTKVPRPDAKKLRIVVMGRTHCKIAFFMCHIHFSHIAASPYTKWLNISSSYVSLVAATSLSTRSVSCKLIVISAVAPHSSPALTASPVNERQNLDGDKNT